MGVLLHEIDLLFVPQMARFGGENGGVKDLDSDTPMRELETLFLRYREHGDVRAIASVYDRTAVELLSVATHLCQDAADAEDALQATFLTALESADDWQAGRPLMPWLLGILTNRVKRQRRTNRRQVDPERMPLGEEPASSDSVEASEFTRAVDEAIASLPRAYQSVLVLRLKHGMSTTDIAHAVRRPPGTVRAQLSRGMAMVRKSLPAVFASSLAMVVLPTRGQAAVRAAVLQKADQLVAAGAAAARGARMRYTFWGSSAVGVLLLSLAFLVPDPLPTPVSALPDESPASAGATLEEAVATTVATRLPAEQYAREAAGTAKGGSLEVKLLRDGTPAAAALVWVELLGAQPKAWITHITDVWGQHRIVEPMLPASRVRRRMGLTDAAGVCRFEQLADAFWLIQSPGGSGCVKVSDGHDTRVAVPLPDHVTAFHGTVSDGRGAPVSGAQVWLSASRDGLTTRQPIQTDAAGRFLTYVTPGTFVVARKAGMRPSGCQVPADAGTETHVDLRFVPGGGELRGVVTDANGDSVASAEVQIGRRLDTRNVVGSEAPFVSGVPMSVSTDSAGCFQVSGLDPGELEVKVTHPTKGACTAQVRVAVMPLGEESTPVAFELLATGRVRGSVKTHGGDPLPNVRVFVRSAKQKLRTATDGLGEFVLDGVALGEFVIEAIHGPAGRVSASLTAVADAEVEWHAKLSAADARIAGRVLAQGVSPQRFVVVRDGTQGRVVTRTDDEGRFEFVVPQFQLGRLQSILVYGEGEVSDKGVARGFPLARVHSVTAGNHDVAIEIPESARRSASVTGSLAADSLQHLGRARLLGTVHGEWMPLSAVLSEVGVPQPFTATDLPTGRYKLVVGVQFVTEFELAEGQQLDLGAIRLSPHVLVAPLDVGLPGQLVAFVEPDGCDFVGTLEVSIYSIQGELLAWNRLPRSQAAWRMSVQLPEGRYRIKARDGAGLVGAAELQLDHQPSTYAKRVQLTRR